MQNSCYVILQLWLRNDIHMLRLENTEYCGSRMSKHNDQT